MINVSHEGKTVLVTGGAGGIGVSVCEAFALSKANVIVNYRSHDEESEMFVKSLADKYKIKAIGAKGDLSNYSLLEKIASNYDEYMLKKVSDIVLQDNKEVLSLIKEAISENVNLYDLHYFSNLNDKLKK